MQESKQKATSVVPLVKIAGKSSRAQLFKANDVVS